ncbi:hypothetical protein MKS88_003925 [Plasmodium brasilianum]|uniref:Uncharacterized protein n=2 Tax=Plasmodium (Plasmodium) TaxID=418103 RepID=A0A1A8WG89_PLAMA|nr:conserved Plasmodium protein, unknown function [Plasmodium malariae]KAI4837451.1 hypothetical protein MKS88_003925 [Plasmodium brasilianum]SBS90205.1 conserved Plasmodium protein, unknown function [Plasmodium malariae]SCO93336.1 conserved Plasmodium protein, unknown function [Plasmodium malariae]
MTTEEDDSKNVAKTDEGTRVNICCKINESSKKCLDTVDENNGNIQKRFESLNKTIEDMNMHFNNILKDNEEKYVLTFNAYMYDVQKEIRILKKIVKEEKIKELKDEKVKKLQKELKWYINECLRLDNVSQFLKKEAEKWKRNSELMKNHMLFLEKKLSKMYETVIRTQSIKNCKEDEEKKVEKTEQQIRGKVEKEEDESNKGDENDIYSEEKKKLGIEKKLNKKGTSLTKEQERVRVRDEHFECKLKKKGKTDNFTYKELNYKITNLENKLKRQMNINCSLQEKLTKHYIEKSKYEKLFIDCVQQLKKDIGKQTMSNDKEKYIEDNFSALINESELSTFTKEEKKKLLITFFSSNDLIHFMKKNVFCKEKTSFDFHPKYSYPNTTIKYQKRSDISPFIL